PQTQAQSRNQVSQTASNSDLNGPLTPRLPLRPPHRRSRPASLLLSRPAALLRGGSGRRGFGGGAVPVCFCGGGGRGGGGGRVVALRRGRERHILGRCPGLLAL